MSKKIVTVVLVVLAFIAGGLLPKPNQEIKAETNKIQKLKKGQTYKAGDYMIWFRSYRGKGGKIYQKIDIQGKHNLIGSVYKKGATIDERKWVIKGGVFHEV